LARREKESRNRAMPPAPLPPHAAAPGTDAGSGSGNRNPIPRWATPLYLAPAAALVPWIVYLNHTLPERQLSPNYRLAWVGFDVVLLGQLARTGYLALRPTTRPYVAHHATACGYLLIVDAWFDITTAATTGDRIVSIVLAALVELPLAALCRILAIRIERRSRR
jgi:hypothetical protein